MQQLISTSVSNSALRFPINTSIVIIPKFQNYIDIKFAYCIFHLKKKSDQLFIPV